MWQMLFQQSNRVGVGRHTLPLSGERKPLLKFGSQGKRYLHQRHFSKICETNF
jgi:hypothetical protein